MVQLDLLDGGLKGNRINNQNDVKKLTKEQATKIVSALYQVIHDIIDENWEALESNQKIKSITNTIKSWKKGDNIIQWWSSLGMFGRPGFRSLTKLLDKDDKETVDLFLAILDKCL